IRHEVSGTVTLAITCSCDQLRVDVFDTCCFMPVVVDAPADAETGRGLMLVATLSADWGFYRTPAGKAVYFTLAFAPDLAEDGGQGAGRGRTGELYVGTVSGRGVAAHRPRPNRVTSTKWCAGLTLGQYRSVSGRRASSGCGRRGSRWSAGIAAAWRRSPGWTIPPPPMPRS